MKNSLVMCFLLLWLTIPMSPVAMAAGDTDLAKADWSVKAPHNVADNPPSSDEVWKFINDVWKGIPTMVGDVTTGKLCSFRFVNLQQSGRLSLVTVSDADGTGPGCDGVGIFDKGPKGIEYYPSYHSSPGSDVGRIIRDLNGDGHLELVLDDPIDYEGLKYPGVCQVLWPRVYAWAGGGYTEVSSQYPKYYEGQLASIKEKIAAIDASKAAAQLSLSLPCQVRCSRRQGCSCKDTGHQRTKGRKRRE